MPEHGPLRAWLERAVVTRLRKIRPPSLLLSVLIVVVATVSLLLGVVFIGVQFFHLRIRGSAVDLGESAPIGELNITVDTTSGWQNSGVYVHKGEHLELIPSGRIHLAANHFYNLAQILKPLIVQYQAGAGPTDELRHRYPAPHLDESNVFYRDWVGPDGEGTPSDMLDACRIRSDLTWGRLLAGIFPVAPQDRIDPLRLLKEAGFTAAEILPIAATTTIEASRDGWLAFIVNDAVMSPIAEDVGCREMYAAITRARQQLISDVRHQFHAESIPLIWFGDNLGSFRVLLRRKP